MFQKIFVILLIFVPITILTSFIHVSPTLLFFLSACAIVPLAKFIGEATEELSGHTGPAVGGLLNATFGNATELIIGIVALHAGFIDVVKASITGSIIGNLLLVLGASMVAGGIKNKEQAFNKTGMLANTGTLFLAVIAFVIPAIFFQTSSDHGMRVVENLSIVVAIGMIVAYSAFIFFSLRTHKHLYNEEVGREAPPDWSVKKSLIILILSTVFVGWMSEILVGSIEPIVAAFGWTELFIGVIFVAIIGNAAEHASAVTMAMKNRMDLALQISVGSATQIAMFAAPVLVLVSLAFEKPMNLVFNMFELITIVLSVFIANLIVQDGKSNWYEGALLLLAYAMMGAGFFYFS